MTMFENRSAGTTYDDRGNQAERGSHQQWDSHQNRDGHQQHAGLPMAGHMMCMWTVASYDYALQVLKAQQQFTHSMLVAAAPMLNVVRDITSANKQLDARSDRRHEGSHGSRENERYNDDDSAEYNKRLVDSNRSDDNTSDTSRTQRANTQTEESAKTREQVTANTTDRKRP